MSDRLRERDWFGEPRSPGQLFSNADQLRKSRGCERFFNEAGLSWLREAWTIGRLGIACDASRAWLASSDPPDGYLGTVGATHPIEVTEAMDPLRRRGDEYRTCLPALRIDDHWQRTEEEFDKWVKKAASDKIEKDSRKAPELRNPEGTILAIHLRGLLYFLSSSQIWQRLRDALPPLGENFIGFTVVHGSGCYFFDDILCRKQFVEARRDPD